MSPWCDIRGWVAEVEKVLFKHLLSVICRRGWCPNCRRSIDSLPSYILVLAKSILLFFAPPSCCNNYYCLQFWTGKDDFHSLLAYANSWRTLRTLAAEENDRSNGWPSLDQGPLLVDTCRTVRFYGRRKPLSELYRSRSNAKHTHLRRPFWLCYCIFAWTAQCSLAPAKPNSKERYTAWTSATPNIKTKNRRKIYCGVFRSSFANEESTTISHTRRPPARGVSEALMFQSAINLRIRKPWHEKHYASNYAWYFERTNVMLKTCVLLSLLRHLYK